MLLVMCYCPQNLKLLKVYNIFFLIFIHSGLLFPVLRIRIVIFQVIIRIRIRNPESDPQQCLKVTENVFLSLIFKDCKVKKKL